MISNVAADTLFSTLSNQSVQMEALAQGAISSGISYYQNGKYDPAVREFKRAISLSPQSDNALNSYGYLAMAFLKLGKNKEAIQSYQSALRLAPNRDDFHNKIGNILLEEGDVDQAVRSFQAALRIEPRSTVHLYSLGQAYLAKSSIDNAKDQFEKIIRLAPREYGGFYGLGQACYKNGEYEKAVEQFNQALVLKQDFAYARLDLGYALADLGRVPEAYEQAGRLQEKDPALAATLYNYIYRVSRPEFLAAYSPDGFNPLSGPGTAVADLDPALEAPGAYREFTMKFVFSKEMNLASVENPYNWEIRQAASGTPGGAYNWGVPVPATEASIPVFPDRVRYDWESNTAILTFTVDQNNSANATLDPSHLIFQFSGKDSYGNKMDPAADQYGGISKIV